MVWKPRSTRGWDVGVGNKLMQLASLEHFHHDIAAANEFALDVKLRDGRPVGKRLDALTDLLILQHIDAFEGKPEMIEDSDRPA